MKRIAFPSTRLIAAGAAILLGTAAAFAGQPDEAGRAIIKNNLKTQLSVPGSLTIMHVDVTKANDKGLQTACGWFISKDASGGLEQPRAFAMSYFASANLAQIHIIGNTAADVQTIRAFCKEQGIDF
ncbi:MAG: hypothetical protein JNM20_10890 [Rhizobiales bacterium]|nr:hypothetical protein [Hyphomicrobiales bacterium]